MNKALEVSDDPQKQKQINDEMLIKVLKIQDLVKEVQSNAS